MDIQKVLNEMQADQLDEVIKAAQARKEELSKPKGFRLFDYGNCGGPFIIGPNFQTDMKHAYFMDGGGQRDPDKCASMKQSQIYGNLADDLALYGTDCEEKVHGRLPYYAIRTGLAMLDDSVFIEQHDDTIVVKTYLVPQVARTLLQHYFTALRKAGK
jgi:hypothetical protein